MRAILDRLRGHPARREHAHALYVAVVEQARRPVFYARLGVPDTLDGRFDMIVLHAFVVLRRLRRIGPEGVATGQTLFEVMFADMDRNLREMGVGDLGVGRRVKAMTKAFMGRVGAYERACAAGGASLGAALERNVYRSDAAIARAEAQILADYTERSMQSLAALDDDVILAGRCAFAAAPADDAEAP